MDEKQLHRERRAAIVRDAPNVKQLYGNTPHIALIALIVIVAQLSMAIVLAHQPWWLVVIVAYGFGAFAIHYLNVIIHECSHNLVLKGTNANKAFAIVANLPSVFPSAIAFRYYHLLHHRYLGQRGLDADAAPAWEAQLVGKSVFRKLLWLLLQPITYGIIHPLQVVRRVPFDVWLIVNALLVVGVAVSFGLAFGFTTVLYLVSCMYFSLGPHPTGAHVLQEHLFFDSEQETSSYYGPINLISINHGYHLEHHDFPNIPGTRLPELHRLAPYYYSDRFSHRSRIATLWRFVVDRRIALDNRVIRSVPDLTAQ